MGLACVMSVDDIIVTIELLPRFRSDMVTRRRSFRHCFALKINDIKVLQASG